MSTTFVAPMPSVPTPAPIKKKRVLLVDGCEGTRNVRAEAMRKLGMDVDCACDISEARYWWKMDRYGLVIMSVASDAGDRDRFCEYVRGATPPQQVVFLVGKPEYFSNAPGAEAAQRAEVNGEQALQEQAEQIQLSDPLPASPQRWGILEASRRISEVRSVSAARAKAIRERPAPPRDHEKNASRRAEVMSRLAAELQREELL
jgi:CheY-like chemotaxis protein